MSARPDCVVCQDEGCEFCPAVGPPPRRYVLNRRLAADERLGDDELASISVLERAVADRGGVEPRAYPLTDAEAAAIKRDGRRSMFRHY